jgi:hypothetical protein
MNKVTPEEIAILKRIASIESISHKVETHLNAATEQKEEYDCFYDNNRGLSFEWKACHDTFDDFIKEYAQYKYDCGYQIAAQW